MAIQRCLPLCFVFFGVLLLSACKVHDHSKASSVNDEPRLFEIKQPMDLQRLSTQASSDPDEIFLKALQGSAAIKDARFIDIDPALVKAGTSRLSVPLPNGKTVTFQRRHVHEEGGDIAYWYGDIVSDRKLLYPSPSEVEIDPTSQMILMRQGQRLNGTISLPGQRYRLENAGNGRHTILTLGASNLVCEPIEGLSGRNDERSGGAPPPKARSTIRVMFASTEEARAAYPNSLEGRLKWLLWQVSTNFQNSNVDVEFEYAGYMPLDLSEQSFNLNLDKLLAEIRGPNTDLAKKVAAVRESNRADLVLTAGLFTLAAGKAPIGVRKTTAFSLFSITHQGDALSNQIGHMFGARHTWKDGSPPPPGAPYAFAHELRVNNAKYRTIMGIFDGSDHYELNQFSDPTVTFGGIPLGTKEHSDTVRLFNEVRDEIANFYP
ncbi:hypothetical protein [Pseudomonas maumuensis]|uniref:Lipoprotein n=1 Tax=Pseudomonas maumuensis TaxID=2842354 RepID=A0ABX8NLM5_9PSED|nr:hypothetical protein [Pseudomonas maumuensis]QXH56938.1 hypothetical protein KSS90_01620 [Pseudomonas maumuensis]